jgi:hypothetical protein
MIDTLLQKPLFSLTVGEFLTIQKDTAGHEPIQTVQPKEKKSIRGIHGLAKYLGVSPVTAQSLKNSGKITFSQFGRVILFDEETLLKEMALIGKKKLK